MVQVKVSTALQDDWVPNLPCHVMNPVPLSSTGQCNPPTFDTVLDADGQLNIFWLLQGESQDHRVLYNVYYDKLNEGWLEEDTGWKPEDYPVPHTGYLKAAKHPTNGTIHVAFSHTISRNDIGNGFTQSFLYYLELKGRFPKWQSIPIGNGNDSVECTALELAFQTGETPIVGYTFSSISNIGTCSASGITIWTPTSFFALQSATQAMLSNAIMSKDQRSQPATFETSPAVPVVDSQSPVETWMGPLPPFPPVTWDISYGCSPDWARSGNHIASWNWYSTLWEYGWKNEYYSDSMVRPGGDLVTPPNSFFQKFQTWLTYLYPEDSGSVPFVFGLRDHFDKGGTQVLYFPNDPSDAPVLNGVQLFTELPDKMFQSYTPVWVGASFREVQAATMDDINFGINVFALFMPKVFGQTPELQLWHTQTLDGQIGQPEDGVYSITSDAWSKSSLITSNVFSTYTNPYLRTTKGWLLRQQSENSYGVSLLNVNGETYCTVLATDLSFHLWKQTVDGVWTEDIIEQPDAEIKATKTQTYSVDIAVTDDQGTPQAYTTGKFYADIPTIINLNGVIQAIQAGQNIDLKFNRGGRCGLTVNPYGSIIPDTFSVWVSGMADNARIDVQPAPQDLHDKLQNCTTDDMKGIAGSGVSEADLQTAATSLQKLSLAVTGPSSLLKQINSEYIHPATSPHVARLRSETSDSSSFRLGQLPVGHELSFHISFRNGFSCTSLTREEALSRIQELTPVGGFLGVDWGDVWDNVTNAVYTVADMVVTVSNKAVEVFMSGIDKIVQGLTWAWNGAVKLATQVADMASAVFNYIKSTWDLIVTWLGFLFDWGDIQATAHAFQDMIHHADQTLLSFINTTMKPITGQFFDSIKANMNTWFAEAGNTYGQMTIGQYTSSSSLILSDKLHGKNLTSILDELPSPGTWLLNKLLEALDSLFGIEDSIVAGNAVGLDNMLKTLNDFLNEVNGEELAQDFLNAVQAVENLISTIITDSIFSSTTFGAIMTAIQSLAVVAVDVAKAITQMLINMFTFIAERIVSFLETPINIPIISWLYKQITGSDMPSVSEAACFALAIPFTIIYKIAFGNAPYQSSAEETPLGMTSDQKWHAVLGVSKIIVNYFGLIGDIANYATDGQLGAMGRAEVIWTFLSRAPIPAAAIVHLDPTKMTMSGDMDFVDACIFSFGFVGVFAAGLRVGIGYVRDNYLEYDSEADRIESRKVFNDATYGLNTFAGVGTILCGVYAAASNPSTDHDKLATAALFVGGFSNSMMYFKRSVKSPQVVFGASLTSFAAGIGSAAINFSLADVSPDTKRITATSFDHGEEEVEEEEEAEEEEEKKREEQK